MDRRKFFEAIAGSGAIAWVGIQTTRACQMPEAAFPNPVPFVQEPGAAGVSSADVQSLFSVSDQLTAQNQTQTFPLSVASGDPQPNGIVLWTRVDPAAQNAGTVVVWQIATSPDFSSVVVNGIAQLSSDRDNTIKLPVSAAELLPSTAYYYRFIYNSIASRVGRFKTLPAANSNPANLRFGFVVCQDYGNGYYTAYTHLANENIDFVLHLGDYIYETIGDPSFQSNAVRAVPPFPSGAATTPQTLDDYRHLYKVYRGDLDLQRAHEQFAFIQLWDDHEFANDCHQDFHPDNNPSPDAPLPDLRQAANRAWSEYGLADTPFDSAQPWDRSIQVYRKFSFGSLMDLLVTDQRLYRDGPPCGNNQVFERYFSIGCGGLQSDSRTMLGSAQRDWFLQQVRGSKATWKLWANEVMLMQLKIAGAIFVNLDQWDGYPKERAAILNAIDAANVKNLVALTGDLHTFLAGYLRPNFNNIFQKPVGVELMVGSITSANLKEEIESAIDLPSSPMPAKQFGVPPNLLEPLVRLNNPHIQYWNGSTHGYAVIELTPAQLSCTFNAVTTIRSTPANLVRLRTFTVPAGQAKLQQT